MWQTARAILKRDPAATNLCTVLLTYPGLHALAWHRLAHYCERRHWSLLAALISQHAAHRTGILIHPAAQIGQRVFIDHG
ncbi:serine acetyltransferase, partial [Lactiplantibacillus pentosus]|nr:serine acetyltransferase [Lactiplantibacillus pentosus]